MPDVIAMHCVLCFCCSQQQGYLDAEDQEIRQTIPNADSCSYFVGAACSRVFDKRSIYVLDAFGPLPRTAATF